MIRHIAYGEETYPAKSLCGRTFKGPSRLPVPIACVVCMDRLTMITNGDLKWEAMKTKIDEPSEDPYADYRNHYKGLMTKAATALRNALKFGGRT